MSFFARGIPIGLLLIAAAGPAWADPPPKPIQRGHLPPTFDWLRNVEAVQMLGAIVTGNPPSSGDMGWFHPGQSQYSWKWLVDRMDRDHDGVVSKQEFTGAAELFDRLDRDRDGRLTAADFDWSARRRSTSKCGSSISFSAGPTRSQREAQRGGMAESVRAGCWRQGFAEPRGVARSAISSIAEETDGRHALARYAAQGIIQRRNRLIP